MKKNKLSTYIIDFDRVIFYCYLALCLIGVLVMVDITSVQSSMSYFYRHIIFLGISFSAMLVVLYFFNLEKLRFTNTILVYIAIAMLVWVLVKGATIKGATRQLRLGPINFQPSFFARIALIFFFANVLDKKNELLRATKNIFRLPLNFPALSLLTVVTLGLIYAGKHLSAIIISGMTLLGILFYAGIRKRIVFIIIILSLLAGVLILTQGDSFRMRRMTTFKKYSLFFPERDLSYSDNADYQVRESLTALTSGGLWGTGMARGRAKHYYLPEARTDYVYSIIGEEAGYFGAMLVIILHSILFFASLKVAERQESLYLKLLAAGMALNIYCNVLVNTGVAMSIIPSTGNTLPFISYGGSALLMDSIAVGVILNISARRRKV
nr:cell division protein FtsW [Candidatus Cloacimonadota bacterium]